MHAQLVGERGGRRGELKVAMSELLNTRERDALDKLSLDHTEFSIRRQLVGIREDTLTSLVVLGLVEVGTSARHHGQIGWRITPDYWQFLYGAPHRHT